MIKVIKYIIFILFFATAASADTVEIYKAFDRIKWAISDAQDPGPIQEKDARIEGYDSVFDKAIKKIEQEIKHIKELRLHENN